MSNKAEVLVLDTFAILAYLNKEKGWQKVRTGLKEAKKGNLTVYMHELNLGEVYYIIHRRRGREEADKLVSWLRMCPISFVGLEADMVIRASRIKAVYPISYADSFAVATAVLKKAKMLTGDPELRKIEKIVSIEWF